MLTFAQASKLSQDALQKGVFVSVTEIDQFISALPWSRVNGRAHTYVREGGSLTAHFVADGGAVAEGSETFPDVSVRLRPIGDAADVPRIVSDNMQDLFDQAAVQVAARAKAMGRLLKQKLITGDAPTVTKVDNRAAGQTVGIYVACDASTGGAYLKEGSATVFWDQGTASGNLYVKMPGDRTFGAATAVTSTTGATYDGIYKLVGEDGTQAIYLTLDVSDLEGVDDTCEFTIACAGYEFDGLKKIISTGPTAQYTTATGGNGEALSFDTFRILTDLVDPSQGQPSFIMSPALVRAYLTLLDAKMTATAYIELPNYGLSKVLSFDGLPVFKDEFIVQTETQGTASAKCSHMYCVCLGTPSGRPSVAPYQGSGLVGLYGAGSVVETPQNPILGVNIDKVALPSDGSGNTLMVDRYVVSGYYGLALHSTKAGACRYGVYVS